MEEDFLYLVGLNYQGAGVRALLEVISRADLEPHDVRLFLEDLERVGREPDGWEESLKAEYLSCVGSIERLATGEGAEHFGSWGSLAGTCLQGVVFKPQQTRRLIAEVFRGLLESPRPAHGSATHALSCGPEVRLSWPPLNLFGRSWARSQGPSLAAIAERSCMLRFHLVLPRVTAAINAHRKERGEFPASLEDLVPRYLERVPEDPFDGRPIRYSREKAVIYSVGADGVDEGGNSRHRLHDVKEPTWRLER